MPLTTHITLTVDERDLDEILLVLAWAGPGRGAWMPGHRTVPSIRADIIAQRDAQIAGRVLSGEAA